MYPIRQTRLLLYSESAARSYASRIERDYLPFMGMFISNLEDLIPPDDSLVKIPESFLEATENSGMYYDEYLAHCLKKYHCKGENELFENWERNRL